MDFKIVGTGSGASTYTAICDVKSGAAASIAAGDIVVVDGSNPGYVVTAPNGASTANTFVGIATKASTDTAAADGTVEVAYHPTGVIIEGVATTPSNLAQALINTKVTVDVATGTQKVDENDTTNGVLQILRPEIGAAGFDTTGGIMRVFMPCQLQLRG